MERSARAVESLIAGSAGQEALGHAIHAAELYLRAASESSISKAASARLRRRCNELIAYAESLKAELRMDRSAGADILRSTSRLHGNEFPPWSAEPSDADFNLPPDVPPFVDNANFTLSPAQKQIFTAWSRPQELLHIAADPSSEDMAMDASGRCSLVQDITTDCSVVASLCAAAAVLTGKRSILSSIIYPYDHERRRPRLSPSGKYVLRLHFNGCARRVVIDDRLPASRTQRSLFVVDQWNPNLLWPALLEKAYLKVRGGYDFPGSNSGTDLWVMTGWIPEQLFLQSENFDVDETWARIKSAHDSEDVVITLGTGQISAEEETTLGLVGEHDYAVQKLDDASGTRRLLLKNPWCNGPELKVAGWISPRGRLDGTSASGASRSAQASRDEQVLDGLLWVTFEDVAQNFESMYLNWNPSLFRCRQDHHFSWDIPPACFASAMIRNPQFSVRSDAGGLVWILTSRHFVDGELEIARSNHMGSMASISRQLGFMSVLIFDNDGKKVQVADEHVYQGPFVDSPQTLARFEFEPTKRYTVVLDQHGFPLSSYTFTISLFSNDTVEIQDAVEPMLFSKEELGAWTRRTAGGNSSHTTYFLNPQFSLSISKASPLSIMLSTDDRDIQVHADLVWAGGKRANTVRVRDLVTSSGEYRRGCALADIPSIDPGVYTLVCSTFEAGQQAGFALKLSSMEPIELHAVPPDAAGRMRTPVPVFYPFHREEKRRAALSSLRLTRASVSVRSVVPRGNSLASRHSSALTIRISVVHGWGPEQTVIAVSGDGDYEEPSIALRTPEFDMEPERIQRQGMWLVIESMGTHNAAIAVEGDVFSDSAVQVHAWERL